MTTIITRLYSSKKKAESVILALREERFTDRDVDLIASAGSGNADKESLQDEILSSGVFRRAAEIYAEHVAAGKALVVVRAPVGRAVEAEEIVDEFEAVETDVAHTEVFVSTMAEPFESQNTNYLPMLPPSDQLILTGDGLPGTLKYKTPLSSLLGLPLLSKARARAVLVKEKTMPFSTATGLPMLVDRDPTASLVDEATPFSSAIGLPLLIKLYSQAPSKSARISAETESPTFSEAEETADMPEETAAAVEAAAATESDGNNADTGDAAKTD